MNIDQEIEILLRQLGADPDGKDILGLLLVGVKLTQMPQGMSDYRSEDAERRKRIFEKGVELIDAAKVMIQQKEAAKRDALHRK